MEIFKAGVLQNQGSYKSFQPEYINRNWSIRDMEIITLLTKAERMIGKLDMFSEYVPNIDLYIQMHLLKEATQSSKIEGTETNLAEALLEKEAIREDKRDDWQEVQNYIAAQNFAMDALSRLPFSSRLIKQTHKILLKGVRGKHKLPGEFRRSQNWIGGASLADATFIPPNHNDVDKLMSDLEKFAHNKALNIPSLLKIGIIHYQFETIHPFLDGNGRVGRLLIPLYLVEQSILSKPILYLSDFFERNRTLYYDNLMRVRNHNDIRQWMKFFLVGIIETAQNGVDTFDQLLRLKQRVDDKLITLKSRTGGKNKLIRALYQKPIVDVGFVTQITDTSLPASYKLLNDFEQLGILKKISEGGKRLYIFKEYVKLFQ